MRAFRFFATVLVALVMAVASAGLAAAQSIPGDLQKKGGFGDDYSYREIRQELNHALDRYRARFCREARPEEGCERVMPLKCNLTYFSQVVPGSLSSELWEGFKMPFRNKGKNINGEYIPGEYIGEFQLLRMREVYTRSAPAAPRKGEVEMPWERKGDRVYSPAAAPAEEARVRLELLLADGRQASYLDPMSGQWVLPAGGRAEAVVITDLLYAEGVLRILRRVYQLSDGKDGC